GTSREYIAMFEKLACQLAGVSQSVLEATFIKGLKPDLRAAVRVMKPESLAHAMDLAISIEDNQQFEGVTRTGVGTYRSNTSGFSSSNLIWVDDSDAAENEPYLQVKRWDHALKAD
ncbi:hypothetical protein Tco_1580483, partial [Tanacetum coccineum]